MVMVSLNRPPAANYGASTELIHNTYQFPWPKCNTGSVPLACISGIARQPEICYSILIFTRKDVIMRMLVDRKVHRLFRNQYSLQHAPRTNNYPRVRNFQPISLPLASHPLLILPCDIS